MRQEKLIEKLFALIIGFIVWAAFLTTIYELTVVAAEGASGLAKVGYYLLFTIYFSLPFDAVIAYVIRSLR